MMAAIVCFLGAVTLYGVFAGAVMLSRRRDEPDPHWSPTGYHLATEAHYDERLAVLAAKRANTRTPSGRPLPQPRGAR